MKTKKNTETESQTPANLTLQNFSEPGGEKQKLAKDAQRLRLRVDLNSLKPFCSFKPQNPA